MAEPKPIGELITELANTWDPKREAEAHAIAAFLTGSLYALCSREDTIHLKIDSVEMEADESGDYPRSFTVITSAGHRLRVSVEAQLEPVLT